MMAYLLYMLPAFILAMIAQGWVRSAYAKWSQIRSSRGLAGAEVAASVLQHAGIFDVQIEPIAGEMTDHYDPGSKTLRLSEGVFASGSVAAAAIAAHEAGHAIQHARNYAPLQLRSLAVPAASIGSRFSFLLLFIGMLMATKVLIFVGIALFSAVVVFQLITLPVELDASRRAKIVLRESGVILDGEEARGVSTVLSAAALTYVAATLQSVLTLLYYLQFLRGRD